MTDILRDMRRFFDAGAISRGVDYHGRGLVKSIRPDPSGSPVEGRVSGSGGRVYEQYVYLDWAVSGRLIEVDGECTCPVGWNCKHVVAVVLASERQLNSRSSGLKSAKGEGLPYEVTDWLNSLEQAKPQPPKPTNDCIVYVIDRERGQPSVLPMKSRFLKSGDLSTSAKPYSPDRALGYSVPKFLEPSDIQILASLAHHQDYSGYGSGHSLPTGGLGQWLFEEIVKTGRARLGAIDGVALAFGGAREARFDWVTTPSGVQVMAAIDAEQREMMPLGLTPPWYVDLQTGAAGPIATDLDPMRAAHIAAAPALSPEAASKVIKRLAKAKDAPLPRVPEQSERKDIAPKPRLSLRAIPAPLKPQNRSPQIALLPAIDVRFDYDGVLTSPREPAKKLRRTTEQKIETILRDARTEDGFLDELAAQAYAFGFLDIDGPSTHAAHVLPNTPEQTAQAIAFMTEGLPALESEGWQVDIDESWPYRFSPETPEISGKVTQSDNDWFALAFSIKVGDVTTELAPILAQIVTELSPALLANPNLAEALEETTFYPALPDGTRFAVQGPQVAPLLATFQSLTGITGELHASEAESAWQLAEALEGTSIQILGFEALKTLADRIRPLMDPKAIPMPEGLAAEPRPYQRQGYGWLTALSEAGFGGVLADDMGLGKTLQALSLLLGRERAGPSLAILPTSLVATWQHEAARFAPKLRVLTLHGPERKTLFEHIPEHDLVLTTYPLLHRDHEYLSAQNWDVIIADEGQTLKNPASAVAKHVRKFEAQMRIVLSGTPIENTLQELWAIFDWVNPGLLGNRSEFKRNFQNPIERDGDASANARLKSRIRPFLLRRTKEAVATDLPPKTEITERIPLGPAQQGLYETVRIAMDTRVRDTLAAKGLAASRITVLDALLKLRQVACDPILLKSAPPGQIDSAKRARLLEMLATLIAEGRRILVFSQFVEMLNLIEGDIARHNWSYLKLTGQTKNRGDLVDSFQNGEADIFLISLKAGGTGLTLTAADTVILYDPWWNPATERQAMDRTHRIGQTNPVFVYRLIAQGTVEEAIEVMQARKQGLADALFEDGASGGFGMSEDELLGLFAKER